MTQDTTRYDLHYRIATGGMGEVWRATDSVLGREVAVKVQRPGVRDEVRADMATLGRDLQALREWYARTTKAVLRRAILADANRIIRRMQRVAAKP